MANQTQNLNLFLKRENQRKIRSGLQRIYEPSYGVEDLITFERMISENSLRELQELSKKNTAVKEFLDFLQTTPYYQAYIGAYIQFSVWSEELKTHPTTFTGLDNAFERSHKFMTTQKELCESLEYLRLKLLPQQVKSAEIESTSMIDEARINLINNRKKANEV